jgi:PAS domain S-box-containing protein
MKSVVGQAKGVRWSSDLRILAVMVVGVAVCGVLDGSRWRSLLAPTIAYRPAFLFALTLVLGWRGFVWSQLIFLASFAAFMGWRGAVFVTPLYLLSHGFALVVARRLVRDQPSLSTETAAALAGAVLAPVLPALFGNPVLQLAGIGVGPGVPAAIDSWLRGSAATLAMAPAVLMFWSAPLKEWVGLQPERYFPPLVDRRRVLELGVETAAYTAILWISVYLKAHYGFNVTYMAFLPLLAFTFYRGMAFAVLALLANTIVATTLWQQLHWAGALSALDLRLFIAICSLTALTLAALVEERQRNRVEVETLRAAETALRVSEERFRFAQKAASIGTFDWNCETGSSAWTPELERIYGLPPGGFPGTHQAFESLVYPDDRPRVLQRTRESLETGAPAEEEWRVVRPDGSLRWIAGRWQVFNAAGEHRHVLGINIDITDRKNIEEDLRKSEERFRLVTKATNDAVWDIDLKAGTVSWNDTYSVLYGRPDTAHSWQFWIDRIHPEDRARTVDKFQAALGGGATSWSDEYRFRRADGEWAHIHDRAYIARDASGSAWRVIGAMQDLTERRKAEDALRESEERFRRVFEEGPLGLALVGKDYRFINANHALCQMTGYDAAELVRMSFVDITHPDDVRMDVELAARLFKREIPFYRIQKRYLKKNGEIIWINLTAAMIHGPDGEPLHGMAMIEDITEIKRTQEEALIRQKLESLGTLAGGIGHDFNNLLGAIRAQAELASVELDAGSSCREELKAIGEVAVRGSEIVRQLMIYAGKESTVAALIDLSKTVDEMLSLLKVSVTKHAVVSVGLDQDLPAIHASAAQIQQIVMNLITNASDAIGHRDGVIRVTTRRVIETDLAAFSSGTLADGDYVQLEVSDTGRGMSPETKARVFDPFFTTKSAGRGLGLAVVQGIVRSLGGVIRITSKPDKGTTVQVSLPCAKTAACPGSQAISTNGKLTVPSQHAAILVVEDEAHLRRAVVKMLRKRGFEVYEAADGDAAIDLFREHGRGIDAILLDMTLPGAGGREIVAEAARLKPEIRVILTSAYSHEIIEGSITAPQISDFIRKPFKFEDLLKILRNALSVTEDRNIPLNGKPHSRTLG